MERKNYKSPIIIFVFFLGFGMSHAQEDDYRNIFSQAYISGQMDVWRAAMSSLEEDVKANKTEDGLFKLTLAFYGYTGYCIGNDQDKEAKQYLEKGKSYLEQFAEKHPEQVETYAFRSGFYGFEMGLAGYKALVLGPKSVSALKRAAEMDSTNVFFLVEKGNQIFYMLSFLGGDKRLAQQYYRRAVWQMEQEGSHRAPLWYYLNTLVVLAQAYEKTGDIEQARQTFEKILETEPNFQWVRDELFPEFMKKHGLK